jgi:hypothetical protein
VQFSDGPMNGFLGISAKSIKISRNVVYKNPGLGIFDEKLDLKLTDYVKSETDKIVKEYRLSPVSAQRAKQILDDPELKNEMVIRGTVLLNRIREQIFQRFLKMNQDDVKEFINQNLVISEVLYPPFIVLVSTGTRSPFKITITNPVENPKAQALIFGDLNFTKMRK